MKPRPLRQPGPLETFDERDSVFARTRLQPGSPRYEEHYSRRPEQREPDERARSLPNLASPGGQRYRPFEAALVEGQFSASDLIAAAVEAQDADPRPGIPEGLGASSGSASGEEEPAATIPGAAAGSPAALARFIKDAALFLGADDVGVTALDAAFVYSHRGRPAARFGDRVQLDHSHAVVMAFAMRRPYVQAGPEMIATAEVARVYQEAAAACYALTDALRRLGFRARAHVDSNYLVIGPPLAVAAGLGELGRSGILIHPRLGPGVRLGVVTLDAELATDAPGSWGIPDFCRACEKCAKHCPSAAIPLGESSVQRGAEKWPLVPERCYQYWRSQGTDCGVCIRSCPFDKPDTWLHRGVRGGIALTTWFNRFFLWWDDRFYGCSVEPDSVPRLGD